jgi:hypothetical protein
LEAIAYSSAKGLIHPTGILPIGSEQAWELKLLDQRRSNKNFVLFERLLKPGSVGAPPRTVQISGHHLEYDDVIAAVLLFPLAGLRS